MRGYSFGSQAALCCLILSSPTFAAPVPQAEGDCVVSVLNQTANVRPDGSWSLPNIPANMGPVRARVTCIVNGQTLTGTSEFFTITPNRMNAIPPVQLGVAALQPVSISVTATPSLLSKDQSTSQLAVIATYPDSSTADVTDSSKGTVYGSTNPGVATVDENGRVTAVASGRVLLTVLNEARVATIQLTVSLSGDADGDGLPDDFELANGLDPNDPADALEDRDRDGLTNVREFQLGTNLSDADTDGDGISDGEEVVEGEDGFVTSALLADTDGDGISDSLEIEVGTDPTDSTSGDFSLVLESIDVAPASFTLVTNNVILSETSRRVKVTGRLIDGTTVDLTAGRGTAYSSSNLLVANFGDQEGRIFAGAEGNAVVTASNGGFSDTVTVNVKNFLPQALSFIRVPGYANGVAVDDTYAYVAAGTTGLQIVNVSDPSNPSIAGSYDTPGNANDVRVVGNLVYVADGASGLQIIDVSSRASPTLAGTVDTPGTATDLAIQGNLVYIADGASGLQIVDATNPTNPAIVGSVDTVGNARGVDVEGAFCVIADAAGGVVIVNVENPAAPAITGSTHTRSGSSRAADVAVRDQLAYVADGSNRSLGGIKVIDYRNPTTPFVAGATDNRYGLSGITIDRDLALASDFYFVNAVPIFDIGTTTPTIRGNVNFAGPPLRRDDNGTGIAVRNGLVFLTGARSSIADNGTSGDTGLHIGRYAILNDDAGVAPTVEITSPAANLSILERRQLTVEVEAEDDILVQAVDFLVDGKAVFTDFAAPYSHTITVPAGAGTLTLGARATDLAGNVGNARSVKVNILPDAAPTVVITSPANGSSVTEGSLIPVTANASDDDRITSVEFRINGMTVFTDLTEPYSAVIAVPLNVDSITLTAVATDNGNNSKTSSEVKLTVLEDKPPSVVMIEPPVGQQVVEGSKISIVAGALDDVGVTSVKFLINDVQVFEDTSEPFELEYLVPLSITTFKVSAIATDTINHTTQAPAVNVTVIPDPGTTVVGKVVLPDGMTPAVGAAVQALEASGHTGAGGLFSLSSVRTAPGPITVRATFDASGALAGTSLPTFPVVAGITDVGTIVLQPAARLAVAANRDNRSVSVVDAGTLEALSTINLGGDVIDVDVAPGGKSALVTSFSNRSVTFLNLETTPPTIAATLTVPILAEDIDLACTSTGFALIADGSVFSPIVSVDLANKKVAHTLGLPIVPEGIDVTPDGKLALVSSYDNNAIRPVFVQSNGTLVDSGKTIVFSRPLNITISPDGKLALIAGYNSSFRGQIGVLAIDGTSVSLAQTLSIGFGSQSIAFSPDGRLAYVYHTVGTVSVLAIAGDGTVSDTLVRISGVGAGPTYYGVDQIAVTASGDRIIVHNNTTITVIDATTNHVIGNVSGLPLNSSGGGIASIR